MKCSGREGKSGTVFHLSLGLILLIAFSTSIASATIQDQIDLANASPVTIVSGTYEENVNLNKPYTVVGVSNPTVIADNAAVSTFRVTANGAGIAGFTITGATSASGVEVSNSSPRILYNNINGNQWGVYNENASPVDARYCYWGSGGADAHKGEPGVGGNNPVGKATGAGSVNYIPWLTAPVTNGRFSYTGSQAFVLDNTDAGVKVRVVGGTNSNVLGGSAAYLAVPYGPGLPGIPIKYVDAFVEGNTGGTASVTTNYADTDLTAVTESSIKMYLWTGSAWALASGITRDLTANKVTGSYPSSALTGSPIALSGQNYSVTILPEQTPGVPISSKPVFSTFRIESTTDIINVYYQIDNHISTGWIPIQTNVNAGVWNWPLWAITDQTWADLSQGTHTFYFMFTRAGVDPAVGDKDGDRISWQFFKSSDVSFVRLISPNGGETLTRQPHTISWSMPAPDDVDSIILTYSRDGGLTYPYLIASLLGPYTSYDWRSPNIWTSQGRVKVTVRYTDGLAYSDTSDANFNITKGFSLLSWRPTFGYTSFRAWVKPPYSFRLGG